MKLARHERSWETVHKYVDDNLKVWTIKPESSPLPTLLPWIEQRFEEMTYLRSPNEEGHILFVNLPTMGVVSAMKLSYVHSLCTSFLASRPSNAVAVILHANRASEGRNKSGTQGYYAHWHSDETNGNPRDPSIINLTQSHNEAHRFITTGLRAHQAPNTLEAIFQERA